VASPKVRFGPQNKTAAAICQRPTGHNNVLRDKKAFSPSALTLRRSNKMFGVKMRVPQQGTQRVWPIFHVDSTDVAGRILRENEKLKPESAAKQ
jgi:hypothetical protein